MGKEFMERSIKKPYGNFFPVHNLEQLIKIALLHLLQLCENLHSLFPRI